MDRVEVACDACRAKHGLSRGIMVNKEEGSEENEGEEEVFEEIEGEEEGSQDEEQTEQDVEKSFLTCGAVHKKN